MPPTRRLPTTPSWSSLPRAADRSRSGRCTGSCPSSTTCTSAARTRCCGSRIISPAPRRRESLPLLRRRAARASPRWRARWPSAFPALAGSAFTLRDHGASTTSRVRRGDRHAVVERLSAAFTCAARGPSSTSSRTTSRSSMPAGAASALAEETYRFGLPGIVNTPGLAEVYRSYGNPAVSFVPAVDLDRYHPPSAAPGSARRAGVLLRPAEDLAQRVRARASRRWPS